MTRGPIAPQPNRTTGVAGTLCGLTGFLLILAGSAWLGDAPTDERWIVTGVSLASAAGIWIGWWVFGAKE